MDETPDEHRDRDMMTRAIALSKESGDAGEYRRGSWQNDFLKLLPGVEGYVGERKIKFQGPQPKPFLLRVVGKLGAFNGHPMIEHMKFVKAHTKATAKIS